MENTELTEKPMWRICLRNMREQETYGYGAIWPTSFFEQQLGAKRDTNDFAFAMLALREEIESEDGYYLRAQTVQDEETKVKREEWTIPAAAEHEGVARTFEGKMHRYAKRSVNIRALTLANVSANLNDDDKSKMESSLRIASTRMVLLRREKRISKYIEDNAPKLLK